MHTLSIELPDELARQVLQHNNVHEFAKIAFEKMLLEEEKTQQQQELMAMIRAIKPVKAPLSSEEMVRMLREGKDHELAEIMGNCEQQ